MPEHDIAADLEAALGALEQDGSLFKEAGFVERIEAIDQIQFHILDRIEYMDPNNSLPEEWTEIKRRAEKLVDSLEAVNQKMFRKLQKEVKAGHTRAFRERVKAYAQRRVLMEPPNNAGYDDLDVLISGLLEAGDGDDAGSAWPEETVNREAEMVFYQPTPARAVWELVQKAEVTQNDVFYDLGSGLGQVAILVNLLSGARVKGIEIEPEYNKYARLSANKLLLKNAEFVSADARDASYADGTVFYLYTPFKGKILRSVLAKLEAEARQRQIRVCTYGPCTAEVSKESWLKPVGAITGAENEVAVFKSA